MGCVFFLTTAIYKISAFNRSIGNGGGKMAALDNNCFEKNMSLLKKNHMELFKEISEYQEYPVKTEIIFAENQKPNLRVQLSENESVYIHQPQDPGSESETFLSMVGEDSTGVVLMFGMGLGYTVLELLKKRKKLQFLIIFELNVEFFIHAIKHMDLTALFEDNRVIFSLGEPENLPSLVGPANRAFLLEDIHTLNLTSCFRVNRDYEKVSSLVFDYINAFNAEGATKVVHGMTFFENRLKHLTSMHHDQKLEDLKGRFQGFPALIVAAGPSLDKNIDQIVNAVGKALIISVDTALPILLNHGIKPDFITAIDYNELTYEKISGVASNPACRQINLICTSWVANTVTKQFPGNNIFWAFSNNPIENWINASLRGNMFIGGAGTVAHLNFTSAVIMGCDPIIFVGQDLAFSNNKGHSSNVVLSGDETAKKALDSAQGIMWVKGLLEPEVPTNRQMHSYKITFERMIKEWNGRVINSTEGGAFIEGAQTMTLSQAIETFCTANVVLGSSHQKKQDSPLQSMQSTIKEILKLEKIVKKADRLSGPVQKALIKLKKGSRKIHSFAELPVALQKKISDLDACHNKADKSQLWSIFDEMTMEGLKQDEREKRKIEKLEGIPDKYMEWLVRSVERIDKVNQIRMNNLERFKKQLNDLVGYYKIEKLKLSKIEKSEYHLKDIFDLAKLYFQSGDYVLLEKFLDKYISETGNSKSITHYYYGVIALYHGDYETAENRFQLSVKSDEGYREKIDKKRNEIANNYFKLAHLNSTLADFGSSIVEMLLLKGLKCCPGHAAIKNKFRQSATNDLVKIEQSLNEKNDTGFDVCKKNLEKWITLIGQEDVIVDCLKKETICSFYLSYGKMLVDKSKYEDALNHYQKALSILPDVPDVYIALADIYFAVEAFDSGLQFLTKAVDLDKQYAVYWYNMGKNLQSQDDYNGAILAYEQYFTALPEDIAVLKDIGDCYIKLGNLQAAQEAYQQLKRLTSEK